jgi:MoaA/NifB/PqqE/SkfB family radical SAM enzyme
VLIHQVLTSIGLDDDQADLYRSLVQTRREPRERVPDLAKMAPERAAAALERLLDLGMLREGAPTRDGRPSIEFGELSRFEALLKRSERPVDEGLVTWVLSTLKRYRSLIDVPGVTVIMPADRPEAWTGDTALTQAVHGLMPALDLRIGTICNFNCVYCLVGHEKKSMRSVPELQRELEVARRRNITRVSFTGGEPTIHPKLFELMAIARKLGYTGLTLVTNGATLSYGELVERVLDAGVDRFGFSIDAIDAKTVDALVQRKGMLPAVLKGIQNILDAAVTRPELRTYGINVVSRANLDRLADTARWLGREVRERKLDFMLSFDFVIAEENAWTHREALLPRMTEAVDQMVEALEISREEGLTATWRNMPPCVMPERFHAQCLDDHIHIGRLYGEAPVARASGGPARAERVTYEEEAIDFYRVKRPSCRSCRYFKSCWGVHMSYVHHHGFEEFVPVP